MLDIYLGALWGLKTATIEFNRDVDLTGYTPTSGIKFEVTQNPFFFGERLVTATFLDVQAEIARLFPVASLTQQHGN